MRISFIGGTETVTGSKFLIENENTNVLVDCGLFQGYKWLRERNWQTLPLDLKKIDAVILSHAHLDHSGYIPVLYKQGYRGPIFTHHATKALCDILLADSGHIQEEDAKYFSKHKLGKHAKPEPLYDRQTAEASMKLFHPIDFDETVQVGDIKFHLQPAGHILGAASIILEIDGKRIGFSGDVGRFNDILMNPPRPLPELDLLMMESTYGNRLHSDVDPYEDLAEVINKVARSGGVLMVPAFAVGRAQALQHMIVTLMKDGRVPEIPVYLDSPMAIKVSDIFCRYHEQHKLNTEQCELMCNKITYTSSVEESKDIAGQNFPHIIIAGSGMATGGRILHHFKRLISDPKNTVLFTGYQAGGTRGAKMMGGVDAIKIHGNWIPIHADIKNISGLSGHADYAELTRWLEMSHLKANMPIKLIHGDPDALEGLRVHLKENTKFDVSVAGYRDILRF